MGRCGPMGKLFRQKYHARKALRRERPHLSDAASMKRLLPFLIMVGLTAGAPGQCVGVAGKTRGQASLFARHTGFPRIQPGFFMHQTSFTVSPPSSFATLISSAQCPATSVSESVAAFLRSAALTRSEVGSWQD